MKGKGKAKTNKNNFFQCFVNKTGFSFNLCPFIAQLCPKHQGLQSDELGGPMLEVISQKLSGCHVLSYLACMSILTSK